MKYKVIIFVFCFLLFAFRLLVADIWIKTYEPFGDVDYYPEDIVVCQDGGYAVKGYYNYYDPYPPPIDEEWGFLMKTDSDGNLIWAKLDTLSFMNSNRSYAFVETNDSGFISGISNGILIKRDYNGNKEWVVDEDFAIHSMCNTDDGNIILGGFQSFNIGLRKIDENGNTIWTQVYPIDDVYSICKSIIQTNDGGYALTGYLEVSGTMSGDIIVMKTDANGDSLWTRTFDGYGNWDIGKSITEDSSGNIMVAGEILNPNTTGFLWYLDEEGNTIWAREVDSSVGHSHFSVITLSNNNFVTYCYSGYGGDKETTLYSFDDDYNINWQSEINSNVARGDKCFCELNENGYVCALSNVGGSLEDNIGIAKTDSIGQVYAIDHHEIPHINEITLSNYPNPFNPTTTIQYNIPMNIKKADLVIFNIKGQKIKQFSDIRNQTSIIWDGTDKFNKPVSTGLYLYRIITDENLSKTKKMILTK